MLAALFSAVEHGNLEKARNILESTDVDVNRYDIEYPVFFKYYSFMILTYVFVHNLCTQCKQWWLVGRGRSSAEQQ